MKVLVIGSGGREHAVVKKISESDRVSHIYAAPGNFGISRLAECVDISEENISELLAFAKDRGVELTVVGPEKPLSLGIVDEFQKEGLRIFGPTQGGARLESSKWFAKDLMLEAGLPTAKADYITDFRTGKESLQNMEPPYVIKADGLYGGKGVVVTEDENEALEFIGELTEENMAVVLEEYLEGEELSLLAFTDGEIIRPMVTGQDYKRAYDGDEGPNTGGMGAYAPVPHISEEEVQDIRDNILSPLISTLKQKYNVTYQGVLYAGLILTERGPQVLEFNARFGDPEAQAILPLLETDIVDIFCSVCDHKLSHQEINWNSGSAVNIVLVSLGYPAEYQSGYPITIPEECYHHPNVNLFIAGAETSNQANNGSSITPVTAGGRVLSFTGVGDNLSSARAFAYTYADKIEFYGKQYRSDIAHLSLK